MSINFKDLISIDKNWVDREFTHHYTNAVNDKLKVRLYTIKPTGTTINALSLANALLAILPDYYKCKQEVEKEIKREIDKGNQDYSTLSDNEQREQIIKNIAYKNYREAAKFFKTKSSDSKSGKYGELLLFGMVEAHLNCKMIAHKITNLTNYHDEVKGGDGIFMGQYQMSDGTFKNAYLIGESKIWKNYSGAKTDALKSIDRFYSNKNQASFNSLEFFIAQKDIDKFDGVAGLDIDELYERLNPSSDIFKEQIAVHPILIMYDTNGYDELMVKAADATQLSALIDSNVKSKIANTIDGISNRIGDFPELKKVYLDFILIPVSSVENFTNAMNDLI